MLNIDTQTLKAIQDNIKLDEWQELTHKSSLETLPVEKVTMKLEGRLNKSNMRMIEVELRGKHSRLGGEWFNYTRGFTNQDGDFEIDYGDFMVVGDEEYSDDTNKTTIKLYDAMIKSQVEVKKEDFNLDFPSTLGAVFEKVGDIIGLETITDMTDWQSDIVIRDEYTNTKYTYRDILDHIAELAGGNISIRDGKLSLYKSSDTGVRISPYRTKKMDIGEKVGKFNILNITQEPQHYNRAYPPNWDTIPIDDRVEFVIENNPIALNNTDYYLPVVFDRIKDIEYTTFKAETFGWGIFDVGDIVTVEDYDGNEYSSMITGEISEFYQMFLSEVYSDVPENAKEEYVVYTDRQREGQQVYLIVDQQNGKIEGFVNRFDDVDDKLTRLELDVDGLTAQVQTIHNGNIIPNLNGEFGYMYWTGNGELIQTYDLTMQEGLTINHTFIPKKFDNSLSEWGVSMYGDNTTGKGYVIPDTHYSFKGKVENWKNFDIDVLEYDTYEEYKEETIHKRVNIFDENSFEQGSIINGENSESLKTTYIRTKNYIEIEGTSIILKIKTDDNFQANISQYDKEKEYLGEFSTNDIIPTPETREVELYQGTKFIRYTIRKQRGYIEPSDVVGKNLKILDEKQVVENVPIPPIKETTYALRNPSTYVSFTHQPLEETEYIALKFKPINASIQDRLELTEMMFNRGEPKSWFESTESTKYYANSLFEQLSNKIVLMVDNDGKIVQAELGVDPETGSYFVIGADNISLNGYTEINGKFRVNKDGTVFMQDAYVEGTIVAEKGMVGQLELEDGYLVKTYTETMKKYTQSDADHIRDIIMGNIVPTEYDYETYDLNKDGVINISDFAIVRKLLIDGPNPAEREYRLEIGGNTGTIRTSSRIVGLYDEPFGIEMRGSQLVASGVNTRNITSPNNQNTRIDLMDDSMSLGVNNLESYIGIYSDYYVDDVKSSAIRLLSDGYIWANATNNIELSSQNGDIKLASYSTPYSRVDVNAYSLRPEYNDTTYLGTSSRRWKTVYLQSQPNVSSDIRYKYSVQDIPDDLVEQLSKVEPKMYLQGNRWHFGYIAQDIERALYKWATNKYGLDARHYVDKFAFLHKDESYLSLLYGEISVIKEKEMRDRIDRLEKLVEELITNV